MTRFDHRRLAWSLADTIGPHLTRADRSRLWVMIGAGDLENALLTLVAAGMQREIQLPDDVTGAVREWLSGYSGTEVAAAFEPYMGPVFTAGFATTAEIPVESPFDTYHRYGDRPRRLPVGSMTSDVLDRVTADE